MRILVIGSGGREHALVKALSKDPRILALYALPGNAGMAEATCLPGDPMDNQAVLSTAREHAIDFCIVTPDDPLANGLVDALEAGGIPCFGPTKSAARIESSKAFSKDLMQRYGIPTAAWQVVDSLEAGMAHVQSHPFPLVIKADGLAKGKGVFLCGDVGHAQEALQAIFEDKVFGASGSRAIIEEMLRGPEVSVLVLTDGENMVELPSSMDHKRALDWDEGPNTGGMGAVAPNPFYTTDIAVRCREDIFLPTLRAMQAEGCPFKGCLYFGLMLTQDGPKVLEYNARFGDPETQAVMMLIGNSPLDAFLHCCNGGLQQGDLQILPGSACCVVVASGGYPGAFEKGHLVHAGAGHICYAGVERKDGQLLTSGGRVAAGCAAAPTLEQAVGQAYEVAEGIRFTGRHMRRDIGRIAMTAAGRT